MILSRDFQGIFAQSSTHNAQRKNFSLSVDRFALRPEFSACIGT
jgi:hypothetical protein